VTKYAWQQHSDSAEGWRTSRYASTSRALESTEAITTPRSSSAKSRLASCTELPAIAPLPLARTLTGRSRSAPPAS